VVVGVRDGLSALHFGLTKKTVREGALNTLQESKHPGSDIASSLNPIAVSQIRWLSELQLLAIVLFKKYKLS
jgi:hypothetical protein